MLKSQRSAASFRQEVRADKEQHRAGVLWMAQIGRLWGACSSGELVEFLIEIL